MNNSVVSPSTTHCLHSRRWLLGRLGLLGSCGLCLPFIYGAMSDTRPGITIGTDIKADIKNFSGQSSSHIEFAKMPWADAAYGMWPEARIAFLALAEDARADGIAIHIASAFRNFNRQQLIWDQKARGERKLYDKNGHAVSAQTLKDRELMFAILSWTALPGGSRHHWGTDIDVYDGKAIAVGTSLALTQEESYTTFAKLHAWLDKRIANNQAHGFYRPYDGRGSIGAEPWHLSYRPVAEKIARSLSKASMRTIIEGSTIALREAVLADFDAIYADYIGAYID